MKVSHQTFKTQVNEKCLTNVTVKVNGLKNMYVSVIKLAERLNKSIVYNTDMAMGWVHPWVWLGLAARN